VEAFREGFNQIFPLESLQYFYEDEIEAMLCGEAGLLCGGGV
jgi:E3 ubiquitin-protein ligase TRIP12